MSNKPSRTRLSSRERRAQLVRVATRLLAEGGVGNLSMSAVAQEAGIGRALLYPPDGDVAAAVDIAADLVHGGAA